ncbi:hypothetical protein [Streptomyces sp. NPDC058757]|uniref:hypothetical protein n=1 Tax=Streptomyces sp. NPDC058757 TaxID=3346626 RepID=UPI0036C27871
MTDQTHLEAALYDSLARFNAVACWDVLRLAQMRGYLAEHLAADPAIRDAARTAARQTTGQDDTEPAPDGRCTVTFQDGSRCGKDADHRAGRWTDDPHVPEPAPAVGQPAEAHGTDRCASCDHQRTYHDADGQCWFTVDWGRPGSNLVCPCTPRPNTVEDER